MNNTRSYTFQAPDRVATGEAMYHLKTSLEQYPGVVSVQGSGQDYDAEGSEIELVMDVIIEFAPGDTAYPEPEDLDDVSDVFRCVAAYHL